MILVRRAPWTILRNCEFILKKILFLLYLPIMCLLARVIADHLIDVIEFNPLYMRPVRQLVLHLSEKAQK